MVSINDFNEKVEFLRKRGEQDPRGAAFNYLWNLQLSWKLRDELLRYLTPEERLQKIRENPDVAMHVRNPTPAEAEAFLSHHVNSMDIVNPVNHPKSRAIFLNYKPTWIWALEPPPTEYEIFSTVMKNPRVMFNFLSQQRMNSVLYEKYLGLALYLMDPNDLQKEPLSRQLLTLSNKGYHWIPYWKHVLNIKNE